MKTLLIHAQSFEYIAKSKAIRDAEELDEYKKQQKMENVIVVFTTVEDSDLQDPENIISKFTDDLVDYMTRVKANKVVIYPYAHLSPKLAPPPASLDILKKMEAILRKRIGEDRVVRAPFGWYKEFILHCYGHPLSELSRSYEPESIVKKEIEKKHYVLKTNGEVLLPHDYLSKEKIDSEFKILVEKEALGQELGEKENPINRLCAKFGFEWEPLSDYGHMRYGPHATLILEAVSEYSWMLAQHLGIPVLKIKGTNMFDLSARPVYEHAELYGDRLYDLRVDNKHLVVRYAACHQQFAMLRDFVLSYKDLPLGMFELADSYRMEQSGEVTLCFRLRKFHMPDLHILVKTLKEAIEVAHSIQEIVHKEARKLDEKYYAVYNVTEDFWNTHRDVVLEFVKNDGVDAVVTVYPAGIYYWVLNVEYHIIDSAGRPREIATFQFDIGNAKRFGIKYIDEDGNEKYPIIIHTALIGSVERYIYMLFDSAIKTEKKGQTPSLPTWASPIQVRLIPVDVNSKEQLEYVEKVATLLEEQIIRVDIDDRPLSLGRRIRDAGREWIPYVGVIGEREVKTGTVNVTIRRTNDRIALKPEELVRHVLTDINGYPRVRSTLPKYLSKRPTLVYIEKGST